MGNACSSQAQLRQPQPSPSMPPSQRALNDSTPPTQPTPIADADAVASHAATPPTPRVLEASQEDAAPSKQPVHDSDDEPFRTLRTTTLEEKNDIQEEKKKVQLLQSQLDLAQLHMQCINAHYETQCSLVDFLAEQFAAAQKEKNELFQTARQQPLIELLRSLERAKLNFEIEHHKEQGRLAKLLSSAASTQNRTSSAAAAAASSPSPLSASAMHDDASSPSPAKSDHDIIADGNSRKTSPSAPECDFCRKKHLLSFLLQQRKDPCQSCQLKQLVFEASQQRQAAERDTVSIAVALRMVQEAEQKQQEKRLAQLEEVCRVKSRAMAEGGEQLSRTIDRVTAEYKNKQEELNKTFEIRSFLQHTELDSSLRGALMVVRVDDHDDDQVKRLKAVDVDSDVEFISLLRQLESEYASFCTTQRVERATANERAKANDTLRAWLKDTKEQHAEIAQQLKDEAARLKIELDEAQRQAAARGQEARKNEKQLIRLLMKNNEAQVRVGLEDQMRSEIQQKYEEYVVPARKQQARRDHHIMTVQLAQSLKHSRSEKDTLSSIALSRYLLVTVPQDEWGVQQDDDEEDVGDGNTGVAPDTQQKLVTAESVRLQYIQVDPKTQRRQKITLSDCIDMIERHYLDRFTKSSSHYNNNDDLKAALSFLFPREENHAETRTSRGDKYKVAADDGADPLFQAHLPWAGAGFDAVLHVFNYFAEVLQNALQARLRKKQEGNQENEAKPQAAAAPTTRRQWFLQREFTSSKEAKVVETAREVVCDDQQRANSGTSRINKQQQQQQPAATSTATSTPKKVVVVKDTLHAFTIVNGQCRCGICREHFGRAVKVFLTWLADVLRPEFQVCDGYLLITLFAPTTKQQETTAAAAAAAGPTIAAACPRPEQLPAPLVTSELLVESVNWSDPAQIKPVLNRHAVFRSVSRTQNVAKIIAVLLSSTASSSSSSSDEQDQVKLAFVEAMTGKKERERLEAAARHFKDTIHRDRLGSAEQLILEFAEKAELNRQQSAILNSFRHSIRACDSVRTTAHDVDHQRHRPFPTTPPLRAKSGGDDGDDGGDPPKPSPTLSNLSSHATQAHSQPNNKNKKNNKIVTRTQSGQFASLAKKAFQPTDTDATLGPPAQEGPPFVRVGHPQSGVLSEPDPCCKMPCGYAAVAECLDQARAKKA